MPRSSQYVQVGRRKLELSNLEKVLYKADGILKAELIRFYLQVAPTILRHIKGRALSLIRFPDGVPGEGFFQKNKPKWSPDWIESEVLGSEGKIDYVIATEDATLVWLANLACVEIHQWHSRRPKTSKPDYIVYDLDPPEGCPLADVAEVAMLLRDHIESFGYHPFVKTTGGKGLHVVTPIEPRWEFREAFETAELVAKPFVKKHGSKTTLALNKAQRKGKILVDIYRNRSSQTIIAGYSLRARDGAPVATPLNWDEVPDLKASTDFNITNTLDRITQMGDPWEAMPAYAVRIHTDRPKAKSSQGSDPAIRGRELPRDNKHYKDPEKLEAYAAKRDFAKTAEPGPQLPDFAETSGNAFVVHRHDASRLHYDLRLEKDGVLRSWAVPRGMPPRPGVKRLAIATEDHPIDYLTFEGVIPKGEYGGGEMWRFANGRYEITKVKKTGFYFRLMSPELSAEYRIHQTRDNEWLLERVDQPQVDVLDSGYQPMLATAAEKPPLGEDWIYEVKWDGIRAQIILDEAGIKILSRNGKDLTAQFPELQVSEQAFKTYCGIFDGEIVCLDEAGRPDFRDVIRRMQQRGESNIERHSRKYPAYCYLFDVTYMDGRPVHSEPWWRRREWLETCFRGGTAYRLSELVEDGEALFAAAESVGLEGIMAKRKDARYKPGRRTDSWLKVKVSKTADCMIIAYTAGKGDREPYFGSLHLAQKTADGLIYRGRVGSGFDQRLLEEVNDLVRPLQTDTRTIDTKVEEEARTSWIVPELYCEIKYASMTKNGTYREPVFLRMRPDLGA